MEWTAPIGALGHPAILATMRTFEDIVPPSRRSERPEPSVGHPPPRSRPRGRFPFTTVFIALVVIGGSVAALIYFSSAKVEVVPTTSSATVQGSFSAGGTTDLPFQVIMASKEVIQTIPATGTKQVTASASGPITIYNTEAKPQKLVAKTRFATASGLIFRIHSAVTVPAGTTDKPGSVSATAYADAPGPSYNVAATSFTVPGLAGTPQANAVYARSTSAMVGGAEGSVPVVDAAAEQVATTALQGSLAPDLASALQSQVPEGYTLLPGASVISYREASPTPSNTAGKADIHEEGTITAVIFPSAALAKAIALTATGTEYQGGDVTLGTGTSLTLALTSAMPAADTDALAFTLSGTASLVAAIDPMQIATAVAGKSRSEAQVALTSYPEVKRAILVLRPFWKQTFPQDPSAISVSVSAPSNP